MAKIHKVKIPLYPVDLYYCSDSKILDKKFDLGHDSMDFEGYCYAPEAGQFIAIHIPHDDGCVVITHLVHESVHAAMYIAGIVGLDPTPRKNESVAYLAQWISGTILDLVNKEQKAVTT
jgi:hypothetical protein